MLGIYIHIPFCRQKCRYCDFCSTAKFDEKLLDRYVDALCAQFEECFRHKNTAEADTVYFGGGTPSVLGGKRIARLLRELQKYVKLKYPEITVEINPESADKKLFKQLRAAGVNRISMGVQSANDDELRALGRIHTFAQAEEAAALCRKYCTENLSLDLMYGLPGQTVSGVLASLDAIAALAPRHISAYALKLEEGTPLYEAHPVLPDDDTVADMYLAVCDRLRERGFAQYEISNFARGGSVSRHNSKYWDLTEYIGFGCSAHSLYGGKRFSFTSDLTQYLEGMSGRGAIVEEMDELAVRNRSGEYLMLRLRTTAGIGEHDFYTRFGREFSPYAAVLQKYIPSGHVQHASGVWRLTPKGFFVSNAIIGDVLDAACP
ncbi:MAG: radical SAM family heme chaperone HemW [Clostridia bacterium]|nr:radical SAM family heme chaperone HemW [Clostridia bacterium]